MKTLLTIFAAIMITACNRENSSSPLIPSVFINVDQETFEMKQGITYYNHQPFSGWQYGLYETGDTAFIIPFYEGKEYGLSKKWYSNGQLAEIREYANGRKVNEHKSWWEDGSQKFIYHFKNDEFEGNQKEWYSTGLLCKNMNYKNGHEDGLQQMWRPSGVLYANYEVKNGRNYGLTGVTLCKNIWKDVD